MLPQNESSVRSVLASRGATKVRVEGTSIREVVQALFAEEFAKLKKVRLTWNPSTIPDSPNPKMMVGLLRKDRPYTGPLGVGRYFVQNMMVLYSNGEPVKDMSLISNEKRVERIVDGKGNFLREQVFQSDREAVDNALRFYMQIAVRLDPNLCQFCVQFTTEDRTEYLKHLRKRHPQEFQKLLTADPEDDEEPVEEPPPPEPEPKPEPVSRKARAASTQ